jgi:hypothetical protein
MYRLADMLRWFLCQDDGDSKLTDKSDKKIKMSKVRACDLFVLRTEVNLMVSLSDAG